MAIGMSLASLGSVFAALQIIDKTIPWGVGVAAVGIAIAVVKEAEGILGVPGVVAADIATFVADMKSRVKALEDAIAGKQPPTSG